MKFKVIVFVLLLNNITYAQSDLLKEERYQVINALFKNSQLKLDKIFFPFLGVSTIISNYQSMDQLLGHCIDTKKKVKYSYADIISAKDISEMDSQIRFFPRHKTIDTLLISNNITAVNDAENTRQAITLPLIHNNKAIVYVTNKKNLETLFVLVKEEEEWIVRCTKYIYIRMDD